MYFSCFPNFYLFSSKFPKRPLSSWDFDFAGGAFYLDDEFASSWFDFDRTLRFGRFTFVFAFENKSYFTFSAYIFYFGFVFYPGNCCFAC